MHVSGQPPSGRAVRGEGILNTSVAYYLPYGALVKDPNPEEECFQSQVEVNTIHFTRNSIIYLIFYASHYGLKAGYMYCVRSLHFMRRKLLPFNNIVLNFCCVRFLGGVLVS